MRNGLYGLAAAVTLGAILTMGCTGQGQGAPSTGGTTGSSGGTTGSGGKTGTGGSSATGGSGQPACTNGTACGGDLRAAWNASSSCLTLAGDMDVEILELGCASVPVTGSLKVTGTWTANSDGTYTDNTTTTGTASWPLATPCLTVSSTQVMCGNLGNLFTVLGWKTVTCETNSSGQCNCNATADQVGGLGVVSVSTAKSGTVTTSGNDLKTDDAVDYSYCVAGNKLTVTPKPTFLKMSGTIVLDKTGGNTGTGGIIGSGGAVGTGGSAPGTGGTTTGSGGSKGGAGGSGTATGGASGGGKGGAGGAATGGSTPTGGASGSKPCDIFAAGSTACVAAHSTIRALFSSYSGSLYEVKRVSDKATKDVPALGAGGLADSSVQDTFCMGTTCTITKIYDQSGHGNFLEAETTDSTVGGHAGETAASATAEMLMVGGRKVYSLYMKPSQAYWRDGSKTGMPIGSAPQGIYMVTSGKHFNSGCCFDYGNGETNRMYVQGPSMDALYFGNSTSFNSAGNGSGPWVMADLEGGLYAQGSSGKNDKALSMTQTYVTAVEKNNGTSEFTIRGADATTGSLTTFYKGKQPSGYAPNKKQGSIVLGSGGDCCYSNNNASQGTFYEGAIVAGYPSDATDDAIQANVISAGYGK